MEKRGTTTEHDVRELVKQANSLERIVIINMPNNFLKYADGRDKPSMLVIATGDRAVKLREMLDEALS